MLGLLLAGAAVLSPGTARAELRVFPAPADEVLSQQYKVTVEGQTVPVYSAVAQQNSHYDYGGPYSFASVDFSGSVTVKVTSQYPLDTVRVLPESAGANYRRSGDTLILNLDHPGQQLSIEPHGRKQALLLFTNPLETNVPSPNDPGVIYFGPGTHHAGHITVASGQTLYLAGGAVVKGYVTVTGRGASVRGRGILCGLDLQHGNGTPFTLVFDKAVKASLEGIVIRNSPHWTVVPTGSDSVDIYNIKICGGRNLNDDGIDPVNSRNVTIRNCFIRTDDDCISIKGTNRGLPVLNDENITIKDCILWSDRARIFLFGWESEADYMRNITVSNLDIIHLSMVPFLWQARDDMTIRDMLIENVRLRAEYWQQDKEPFVYFDVHTLTDRTAGRVRNLRFRNIALTGKDAGGYGVQAQGVDDAHNVDSVFFEGVTRFGSVLTAGQSMVQIGPYAKDIFFSPAVSARSPARALRSVSGNPIYYYDVRGRVVDFRGPGSESVRYPSALRVGN